MILGHSNRNNVKRSRQDDDDSRSYKSLRTEESDKILEKDEIYTTYTNYIWKKLNTTKYINNGKFMSATKTANYLLDDPIIDWLELYYKILGLNKKPLTLKNKKILAQEYENNKKYMEPYFNGGNFFEELVMDVLKNKFENNFCVINTEGRFGLNKNNYNKTIDMMMKGVGIISQAVLFNFANNTCGIADLLVRSDFINEIVNKEALPKELENLKAPKLNGDYHYLVIDVKWSTLHLAAGNNSILKTGRIPAYKGQIAIYNCALGNMQGYFPPQAYILGKGWKRTKAIKKEDMTDELKQKVEKYGGGVIETTGSNNCFDQLGVIDYENNDKNYLDKTIDAIKWYEDVSVDGMKWSPLDPPNICMYPNMSNDDLIWGKIKSKIAKEIGEVTQVCNVGIKERKILHSKGIYSCRDKKCISANMGLGPTETADKINAVLDINRNNQYNIYPLKIQNNYNKWQSSCPVDFYIDFETFGLQIKNYENISLNDNQHQSSIIFEIGVGWIENNMWNFKEFHINNASVIDERKIIDDLFQFILLKSDQLDPKKKFYPRLFHWTNAEINNLNDANQRNGYRWNSLIDGTDIKYVDMYKVFTKELICVKGAYNYKLKSIGRAMYNLGKIQTLWPDNDITNGQIAMLEAIKYYKNKERNCLSDNDDKIFDDIIKYNEVDCKIIWEIVDYLRKNHNDLDE